MPAKIEGLQRFTVTLNADRLEDAQRKASKLGISPKIIGNTSAFLRMLVDEFADQPISAVEKKISYSEA